MLAKLTIKEGRAIILFAIYLAKEEIILGNNAARLRGRRFLKFDTGRFARSAKTMVPFGLWSVDANSKWRDALWGETCTTVAPQERGRGVSPPGSLLKKRPTAPLRRRQFV